MHSTKQPKRMSAHDVASYGIMAALAIALGYVEILLPLPVTVPGVKLGLGNIIVLFALVAYGRKPALLLLLVKVVVSALLFGNLVMLPFSLVGGLLAFTVMAVGLTGSRLSLVAVSMLGGIAHNLGQLVMVAVLLGPYVALLNLPVLLAAGVVMGLLTGFICRYALRALPASAV